MAGGQRRQFLACRMDALVPAAAHAGAGEHFHSARQADAAAPVARAVLLLQASATPTAASPPPVRCNITQEAAAAVQGVFAVTGHNALYLRQQQRTS